MQSQFVFRQMASSEALRQYAQERLEKIKRYFADPIKVLCTLSVEKIEHVARFDVTLRNGLQLRASEATENMYSSIDMALAKMERQVRRYKERIKEHKEPPGQSGRFRLGVIQALAGEGAEEATAKDRSAEAAAETARPRLVRVKEFRATVLAVDQAIMQMDLMNAPFLVFTSAGTGEISVVFRREDGDYGLIEAVRVASGDSGHGGHGA
jgi:putative sigma-54 modulation protein